MPKSVDEDVAIERELPVKLTTDELLQRGEAMADCEFEIDKQKAVRKGVNAIIRAQTDERAKLAHVIESGVETRNVICKWIADYPLNMWRLVRQDTGQQVDSRPMTATDRQTGFDDVVVDLGQLDDEPSPVVVARPTRKAARVKVKPTPRKAAKKKKAAKRTATKKTR